MVTTKRMWHNPRKEVHETIEGRCPYCHTEFKDIGKHIHDNHKGEKGWKEELRRYGIYVRKRFN